MNKLELKDKKEILARKLIALLPEEEARNMVNSTLNCYGIESHEKEVVRVKLAILKLAGSDIIKIRKMTKYAKEDFRDVLVWAEYPRQSKKWSMPDGPEKKKLHEEDMKEYEQWLNT